MSSIYHITTRKEWEEAQEKGYYAASSLAAEGFMHCSTEDQVAGVLDRYFKGKTDLVKLTIDKALVERPLVFELASSVNELFPHIYGSLNINAVIEVTYL
ncbi:MAG TPA: DUF952 domain-containing protein [Sediminibacterium sp.]|nr:DUF952 domain-containing protein [Sediminibacterium sp.]